MSVSTSVSFDVEAIRAEFPILGKPLPKGRPLVYLDNASTTQKPRCVVDKEREVQENYYANAYRGVYKFGAMVDDELESTREKIRKFIGAAEVEEIVYTSGTTMGINLVANGWGRKFLKPGDEILLTEMEHHANLVPWQFVAKATGAIVKLTPLTEDGRVDLGAFAELLSERTKIVAITGMSNVLGTMPPIEQITKQAHAIGAVVLVDGAQSVPHGATDVQSLGVDFLTFSGHKLYGPSGVGVLYGRRALLEDMDPFLCGGHMISQVFDDHSTWAEIPAKFEAGTLPITQAIGLGAAIDFVSEIGFDAIHAHEQALLEHATEQLNSIPGMKIYGPSPEHKGAICSMTIDGMHPEDMANLLDRKGVFVRHGHHCTMPLHSKLGLSATTRASFAIYNTMNEVDALIDAIHFARKRLRLTD
ncbi:aminotransferase class V-fold PLP-dependent enzyme [Thalassoroseus pseudoceratinae]|uniref:aminotransferase class V-fold PLP-dependent enzyme n=1 Tax=Thalassoroseus pseudoceratinae TaxID=2713176 RepID=UPI00141F7989|nr:SufS family cysteine desulfurase [Thalassoroseus pseudoceratinae]